MSVFIEELRKLKGKFVLHCVNGLILLSFTDGTILVLFLMCCCKVVVSSP